MFVSLITNLCFEGVVVLSTFVYGAFSDYKITYRGHEYRDYMHQCEEQCCKCDHYQGLYWLRPINDRVDESVAPTEKHKITNYN